MSLRKMLDSVVEQEIRNRRSRTLKGVVVTIGCLSTFGQVAYMCVKYDQPDFNLLVIPSLLVTMLITFVVGVMT
jgi:hypothetical protein